MTAKRVHIGGRYELRSLAGEGGMAKVWRAVQHGAAGFTRAVAVKEIKPEYNALRHYIDMFIEEARVGSDLQHPNIVQVHDFVIERESHYLVMEWVEGLDLGTLLQAFLNAGRLMPWPLTVAMGVGALRGLAAAHERRHADGSPAPIIHRDVSPHNILIDTAGVTKLIDFGLARARDRMLSLTAPGMVKGKLSYLSPEVAFGDEATTLSDQFSMGNVLWEALAGRRLFEAPTDLDLFRKIRGCEVEPLQKYRPELPEELVAIIHRALAADPGRRFPSVRAMLGALIGVMGRASWAGDTQTDLGELVLAARDGVDLRLKTERQASLAEEGEAALVHAADLSASHEIAFSSPPRVPGEALPGAELPSDSQGSVLVSEPEIILMELPLPSELRVGVESRTASAAEAGSGSLELAVDVEE